MTSPLLHGYPDFGRQRAETDIVVLYQTNLVLNALTAFGPFFVGSIAALYLSFDGTAARSRLSFEFYLDQAMTQLVDMDGVVINASGYYTGPIPVVGPWVRIVAEASAYPGTVSIRCVMNPEMYTVAGQEGSAGRILHANPTNVAAATTTTVVANASWRGSVSIYYQLDAVAAQEFRLEALQLTGLVRILFSVIGNGLSGVAEIGVHTDAIRAILVNPSAGATNFRFHVIGKRRGG